MCDSGSCREVSAQDMALEFAAAAVSMKGARIILEHGKTRPGHVRRRAQAAERSAGTAFLAGTLVTAVRSLIDASVRGRENVTRSQSLAVVLLSRVSGGKARLTSSTLSIGSHNIKASSSGDSTFNQSESQNFVQVVQQ